MTCHVGKRRPIRIVRRLRLRIRHIAQPLHGNPDLLKFLPEIDQTQKWPCYLRRQHVERDQLPDTQVAFNHTVGTDPQDGNSSHFLNTGR